ncbi:MAG: hypothetical protein HYS32_04250 [Candidatus Woesearchaeota archaeon]|nr:MAG: hypothetical protein HYS32_04250 [Candidatus Woesearchaeota archaeon]
MAINPNYFEPHPEGAEPDLYRLKRTLLRECEGEKGEKPLFTEQFREGELVHSSTAEEVTRMLKDRTLFPKEDLEVELT